MRVPAGDYVSVGVFHSIVTPAHRLQQVAGIRLYCTRIMFLLGTYFPPYL